MDVQVLKSVPFFAELGDEEVQTLASAVTEMTVPEGKEVVKEGDYAVDLFVVEEGEASVLHGDEVVAKLGPGDFFGEAGVVNKAQRSATIRADARMRLIVLDHWAFSRLRKSLPETVERIEQTMRDRGES